MNDNYCAESTSRSNWTNYKKMNCFSSRSVTHIIYNEPVDMIERGEGNIVGGILLFTESYMVITNIFKIINLEK